MADTGTVNDSAGARRPFRRPAMLDPVAADQLPGGHDPALREEVAHTTARALVHGGRATDDAGVTARILALVDTEGLDAVAALWADAAPVTLPGALWRLFVLREWVRRDDRTVGLRYRLGVERTPVAEVVAGAAGPTPGDMRALADAVLSGVFDGDLAVALERASAFCRILATGAAVDADSVEPSDPSRGTRLTFGAASLVATADDLDAAAQRWRLGQLD